MLIKLREWWERLGRSNQIIFSAASVGVVVALVAFVAWASTPDYVPLFSNLSAQDANAISEKLTQAGIPYRLTAGGAGIEVPAQDHDEWQMKMVSQGLPSTTTGTLDAGDDILKGATPMDTQSMEDLRIRRSLEDRVGHTIATMDPIASATVHYAPADDSPLLVDSHPPSASVFVTLKPGRQLTDENVRAIVRLAQMSCTGLSDRNISVVDADGNLLWDGSRSAQATESEFHKQEQDLAQQERTTLQTALDRAFGPHTSIVLAQVELDPDVMHRRETQTEDGATISKSDSTESMTGPPGAAMHAQPVGTPSNMGGGAGAPGGGPGVPQYAAAGAGPGAVAYKSETTQTRSQPTVVTTDTTRNPGQIKKLSVSVLLDSTQFKSQDLTGTEATMKNIVAAAIGATPGSRTRFVTVDAVAFDHHTDAAAARLASSEAMMQNIKTIAGILAPFLIMMIALLVLSRALKRPMALASSPRLALAGAPAAQGGLPLQQMAAGGAPVPDGPDGPVPIARQGRHQPKTFEVIEEQFDANLESIRHLAHTKPDMVAMLVKGWISEEA